MSPVPESKETSEAPVSLEDQGRPAPLIRGRLKSALTIEENEVLETLPRVGSQTVNLSASIYFGSAGFGPKSAFNKFISRNISEELMFHEKQLLRGLKSKGALISKLGYPFHDPLIVSYGASRHMGERNSLGGDEPESWHHDRLSRDTELFDVEEILMRVAYTANADRLASEGPGLVQLDGPTPERRSLELLKRVISSILTEELCAENIKIYPPDVLDTSRLIGVYVETFTGLVPMSALSPSYQATAGWVVDLAWRFLHWYPNSPDPLAEPAIVLIDEIEQHLHPRWQLRIMKDLSSLFQATQFIATTYSPLIVQVAETANLVLLRKREDDVEIVNNPGVSRDYRVDQILTGPMFGVPSPTVDPGADQDAMDLIRKFASLIEQEGVNGS